MEEKTVEEQKELLKFIASRLLGINKENMTKAEKDIAISLVRSGYGELNSDNDFIPMQLKPYIRKEN